MPHTRSVVRPGSPAWCFDVDGTIVDSFDAQHLRPYAAELFHALRQSGSVIHIWSAGGVAHARTVIERHGLTHHVAGFHDKNPGPDGRWEMPAELSDHGDVVCVDDQPDRLPTASRHVRVFPYLHANPHDRDLAAVLKEVPE
ncbi:MAG: hypothetical protein F2681_13585 [Actinobacteria bacterium]|uniref:Unannotated protein n=1 Tax=freshwater metagenome TaxID=449393 RepID=A0A6J6SUW6_9ZZZZ|nr:hypothetical protein [Actinomycetota bacterium]MSW78675.1 hypothetical protein [Actinomycetota bacterium]MSX54036.1 hypothetical protein [Actinomycetota bacterium]MSX92534.1 hypothetical protein [Actinomycetota bacterium]MSZ84166.1 hypothetical protein [Actinomycetota bacterium]